MRGLRHVEWEVYVSKTHARRPFELGHEYKPAWTIGLQQRDEAHGEDQDGTNVHLDVLGSCRHHVKLYTLGEVGLLRPFRVAWRIVKTLVYAQVSSSRGWVAQARGA